MSKLIKFTSSSCEMCHNVASRLAKDGIDCEVVEFDEFGSIINRYDYYGAIIKPTENHVVS